MELITYKTNISSEAALLKIAPLLNNVVGAANWQLDINSGDRKLTVYSPGIVNEAKIVKAIRKAGYKAINLDDYYSVY